MTGQTRGVWAERVAEQLAHIDAAGRRRHLRVFDAAGPRGHLDDVGPVVSFASNDYLGLSQHPAVLTAAHAAIARWGTGATASRLIVGHRPCHSDLEQLLADWKRVERALVFPTGFAANLGVLSVFGGPDVTVLSDELNHASIIDGCRLSRSNIAVYRHNDVDHLERLLAMTTGACVVVTDAVFSMDGDTAPLDAIAQACAPRDALLIVDEAHAVLGPSVPDLDGLAVLRVGTLSKALGSLGGFVAGPAAMIDLLVNAARPFIFSTGLSPADTASAHAALEIVMAAEGDRLRERLRSLIDRIRPGHGSPIIPIVLGDEATALDTSRQLLERGLLIPAIRPPTVPPGTCRLRVALSAAHTNDMIDQLAGELATLRLADLDLV